MEGFSALSASPREPRRPTSLRDASKRHRSLSLGPISTWKLALAAILLGAARPLTAQEAVPDRCTGRTGALTRASVATAFVGANAALYAYFDQAWWSGEKSDFWVNWERGAPFRGQDKLGHLFGGYHLARMGNDLMQLGCISPGRAAWLSAAYAAAFQLQIEVWDGTQKEYGFSPPDLVANTAGTTLAWGQTRSEWLRAFKPTISYDRTDALRDAAEGSELRTTVDYSGQTYWLSADMDALLGEEARAWWPGILRLSLGHTITDWVDPATGRTQWAHRRILLSVDLDPEKLPGDHPLWNRIKHELSYYRFPAPAIQLYPSVKGIGWHR